MKASDTRHLGRSDVALTALGFGGAALGNLYAQVDDQTAAATVSRALADGVGHFDTAPYYGYGLSEERLGRALAGLERSAFTISSKVGRLLERRDGPARSDQGFVGANAFDPVFDYSYDGVMRSFESSLGRLGVDRIDALLLHDIGALTHGSAHPEVFDIAMKDGLRAMTALRDSGAIGAIGLGVNECAVCIEALERADFDCILLAGRYTLLEQTALDALLPLCEARGVSLIVGGPFNSGVLVEAEPSHYDYAEPTAEILEHVRRLRAVCDAHDVPLAAAALQYPLLHPSVASVIPGARTPEEVTAQVGWIDCEIPATLWIDLREAGLIHPHTPT